MKMEGEIISRENIKPSSPTPPQKRIYKLSLLDQVAISMFVPVVLYYPNPVNIITPNNTNDEFISQTTQILKQSLSTTLSLFYPLAGIFRDRLSIDCNDQGVVFVVVKFKESLSDFLKNPDPKVCWVHVPAHLITFSEPGPGSDVAMIQVNYFGCGGIAIGSILSHKVADGVAAAMFLKAWAAAAAAGGSEEITSTSLVPNYTASSFFPQNETIPMEAHLFVPIRKLLKTGKSTMRRYVFDVSAISKLRAQVLELMPEDETLGWRRPSRVEAVAALIWKCFNVASSKQSGGGRCHNRVSYLSHLVNIRRRADPPFPDSSFGNVVWPATESIVNDPTHSHDLKHLLSKVRSAAAKVDGDFVKRMQGKEGLPGYYKNLQETWINAIPDGDPHILSISSWYNFGLYGADFGWGKPTWISKCDAENSNSADHHHHHQTMPFVNMLSLMDTRDGEGVEAWLILDQHLFAEFDNMKELTDLASVDPSPLGVDRSLQ